MSCGGWEFNRLIMLFGPTGRETEREREREREMEVRDKESEWEENMWIQFPSISRRSAFRRSSTDQGSNRATHQPLWNTRTLPITSNRKHCSQFVTWLSTATCTPALRHATNGLITRPEGDEVRSVCVCAYMIHIQYQTKIWTHLLIQLFFFIFTILHQNYEITHMESGSNQKGIIYLRFEILQSCYPLPWWQLCTLLAFSQPAWPGILFQQSWRSSHIMYAEH